MTHIHLKTPNSCNFSFFNRHIFIQKASFGISNIKGYDFSIETFWNIQFEGLWPFNRHFWHIYYNISYIYLYIQHKLNKRHNIMSFIHI